METSEKMSAGPESPETADSTGGMTSGGGHSRRKHKKRKDMKRRHTGTQGDDGPVLTPDSAFTGSTSPSKPSKRHRKKRKGSTSSEGLPALPALSSDDTHEQRKSSGTAQEGKTSVQEATPTAKQVPDPPSLRKGSSELGEVLSGQATGTTEGRKGRKKHKEGKRGRSSSVGGDEPVSTSPPAGSARSESETKTSKHQRSSRKADQERAPAPPPVAPVVPVAPSSEYTPRSEPTAASPKAPQEPKRRHERKRSLQGSDSSRGARAAAAAAPAQQETGKAVQPQPTDDRPPDGSGQPQTTLVSVAAAVVMVIGAALAVGLIVLSQVSKRPGSQHPPACPPPDTELESDAVLLQTKVGRLKGRALTTDGVQLWRFRGVAFAESTAGKRRFAKPVPLQVSDPCTVRPAISASHPCAQWKGGTFLGSEDCLHVSVWAPALPPPEGEAKRVLVVALLGSWFETGSNDNEDWSKLAAKGDVVVVAPNHRQGVLGFMHPPGVDELPKNVALDDVVAGVQWAMDNAAAFHADPKRLVFVGHGSGAYMLSAAARLLPGGAVMRALYQGLVVGSLLPVGQVSKETFAALARALGCNNAENGSVASWIPCFRAASIEKLVQASGGIKLPLRFAPMVDVGTLNGGASGNWPDTVLVGADRRDVIALLNDRILPLVNVTSDAPTSEALLDYTARLFAGEKDVAAVKAKLQPRGNAPLNMSEQLANAMTVCPTRAAAKAANVGYHYSASSSSPSSLPFQPPLSLEDIARFVLHGTPPNLPNESTWPSFRDSPYTRDYDNGVETFVNLEAGCPG